MRVGIATDHGGFGLKEELVAQLRAAGHEVVDSGAHASSPDDLPLGTFLIRNGKRPSSGFWERPGGESS